MSAGSGSGYLMEPVYVAEDLDWIQKSHKRSFEMLQYNHVQCVIKLIVWCFSSSEYIYFCVN